MQFISSFMEVELETNLPNKQTTTTLNTHVPIRVILPTSFQFSVSNDDVQRLLEMRRTFYKKENERKLSKLGLPILIDNDGLLSTTIDDSTGKQIRRRDMEWLSIILPFVKKYNPHCGVCASSKNYGRRLDTANSYLLRSYFYCQGRDCPFNCILTVKENGKGLICSRLSNGNIVDHRNAKRVARPNRSLNKSNLSSNKQRARKSFHPILQQWNQTLNEDSTNNDLHLTDQEFDETSRQTSNKRFITMCSNLVQLTINLRQEIEPNGLLPGALQHISLSPFHLVVHTENSLRYYQTMLTKKSSSVSQIILNIDGLYHSTPHHHFAYLIVDPVEHDEKKLFYYELMLTNADETSFIPISFAYGDASNDLLSQNYVLKSWFERFRFDHEHLYKSSLPSLSNNYIFPQPLIVLVDDHRETPLNNGALKFFNNETFREYIMRTYLFVSSKIDYPVQQDPSNRIVLHVSSSLIIFDFRKLVNKYVSNELRQLAVWSSLLLLYTSTWREMRQNWSLICEIFLNWGTNFVSLKSYEELCTKVAKIENDSDITHLMDLISTNNSHNEQQTETKDQSDEEIEETTDDVIDLTDFQNDHFYTKNMIINENNRYVSPYENDLRRIFNEKNKSKTALISSWETLSNSDRTILKKIKGNWKWLHLLLKDYIPSIPLWSNLIHSISTHLKHVRFTKRITRLLTNKEKRINQIKRLQLAERVHGKTDLVINSLAKDLHSQVINADSKSF